MNKTVKKEFISKQRMIFFDNFMAQSLVFFSALIQFLQFFFEFQLFGWSTTEETFKSSRNAHLVHQNWYIVLKITFTSFTYS
jgi:hypothetical protein